VLSRLVERKNGGKPARSKKHLMTTKGKYSGCKALRKISKEDG
jgi:hypothetical protein